MEVRAANAGRPAGRRGSSRRRRWSWSRSWSSRDRRARSGPTIGRRGRRGGAKQTSTTASGCSPAADQAVKDGYYVVQPRTPGPERDRRQDLHPGRPAGQAEPEPRPAAAPGANCVDLVPDGCKKLSPAEAPERRQVLRRGPAGRGPRRGAARRRAGDGRSRRGPQLPAGAWILVDADDGTGPRGAAARHGARDRQHDEADDRLRRPPRAAARQDGGRARRTRRVAGRVAARARGGRADRGARPALRAAARHRQRRRGGARRRRRGLDAGVRRAR